LCRISVATNCRLLIFSAERCGSWWICGSPCALLCGSLPPQNLAPPETAGPFYESDEPKFLVIDGTRASWWVGVFPPLVFALLRGSPHYRQVMAARNSTLEGSRSRQGSREGAEPLVIHVHTRSFLDHSRPAGAYADIALGVG
jgi:hypothetical protein